MIKKLLKMTLLLSALTAYTACSDKEDIEDPSIRFSEATVNCQNVLTAAPNGWVMAMYGDTDFGGFNVLCKFEKDGKVKVANELFTEQWGADTTAVTHYKLEQSSGIILSFDEYCELFHYFSDPVNPDGFESPTEHGFGGDLEFRVISASADSVVMRGKKHDARILMTPLPADTTAIIDTVWANYLREVAEVSKVMQRGNYHMILGSDSLKLKANKRNRVFTYNTVDSMGAKLTHTVPYVVTPKGITFYEPFIFGGEPVKGFNFAAGSTKYEQDGTKGIILEKYTPDLNEQFVEGTWFINAEGLGTYANRYWKRFCNKMLSTYNLKIYYAVIGTFRRAFGLSVGPVDATQPSSIYIGECYFNYEYEGTDIVKIWFDGQNFDEIGNGEEFYANGSFDYGVLPFATMNESKPKVFKIEADNEKEPTYLRLIDQDEAANVITVYAEEKLYPFGE